MRVVTRRIVHAMMLASVVVMVGCQDRSVSLPSEPYLCACSDGEQAYLFELQRPSERVRIESASDARWAGDWRIGYLGAEQGRYLLVGNGWYLDILTLERFTTPPLPDATYLREKFHSADRWYQFFQDDDDVYWHAQVVNKVGEVVEDLGLVVGYHLSPDYEWVFRIPYFEGHVDSSNDLWVQKLGGGTPYKLTGCPRFSLATGYAPWMAWFPDSRHLFYFDPGQQGDVVFLLCDVEMNGQEVVRTIQGAGPLGPSALSWDFRYFAFTSQWSTRYDGLYAVDLATGEQVRLHDGRDYHFMMWTRDGRYLVVEVDDGSPRGEGPKMMISFPEGKVYPLKGHYPCWPAYPNPLPLTLDDVGSEAPGP